MSANETLKSVSRIWCKTSIMFQEDSCQMVPLKFLTRRSRVVWALRIWQDRLQVHFLQHSVQKSVALFNSFELVDENEHDIHLTNQWGSLTAKIKSSEIQFFLQEMKKYWAYEGHYLYFDAWQHWLLLTLIVVGYQLLDIRCIYLTV